MHLMCAASPDCNDIIHLKHFNELPVLDYINLSNFFEVESLLFKMTCEGKHRDRASCD